MNDTLPPLLPPEIPPPRKHRVRRALLIGSGLLIVLIVIIALATSGSKPGTAVAGSTGTPAASTSAPLPTATPTSITDPNGYACAQISTDGLCPNDPDTSAPAPATSAPAAPATSAPAAAPAGPVGTVSQQQALQQAQGYLSMGQGFSYAGLIAQLDSPYGGQFSVADATWAADNCGADWNAQAVLAAKGYMNLGQGFSRDGLIAQLDSPYGGQFTYAQAAYAAGQVGL